ncbi:MAG: 5'/3'-nucleotidase SurE [Spirochaetaceae bacterium]|nr:MAG: 5'/3'-nucleotidase SurE [Spirochaetaceae bacterium]
MRILLTNDDGIQSEGLLILAENLVREKHEVWMIAPDQEMSASSHSVTINRPVRMKSVGKLKFTCSGTPADCVLIGLKLLIGYPVDLVVAGINKGPNLGTDIIFSGTVAAARQAALMGVPAIAASLSGHRKTMSFDASAEYLAGEAELLRSLWSPDHFVNINFPEKIKEPCVTAVTFPSRRIYNETYSTFRTPDECVYCFLNGDDGQSLHEEGSDFWTVGQGMVSLSPVIIHPENHDVEKHYHALYSAKGKAQK